MDAAVAVRELSKSYPVYRTPSDRLKELATANRRKFHDDFWALRDVSFSVAPGETFGIMGRNGSGKSTLLQIVAGILEPTSGSVAVHGRLAAILELGSAFNHEFTGRQNVYMNASVLGLSREEIDARFGFIEIFADIGEFIDQPVRTYSTGMVMRLAFAVAIHVEPRVLIVDEALAVGDIAFRQKCLRRVHELRAQGVTILFVSHEAGDVKALCDRCIWLDRGEVRALGQADEVAAQYLASTAEALADGGALAVPPKRAPVIAPEVITNLAHQGHRYGDRRAEILGAEYRTASGVALPDKPFLIRVSFSVHDYIAQPIVGFLVRDDKGVNIFGTNTTRERRCLDPAIAGDVTTVDFQLRMPHLAPGRYDVSAAVSDGTLEQFSVCDYVENALSFTLETDAPVNGYLRVPARIRIR